jgi:hypothetical protein
MEELQLFFSVINSAMLMILTYYCIKGNKG